MLDRELPIVASRESSSRRRAARRRAPSPRERERDTTNCRRENSGQCQSSRTCCPGPAEEYLRPARSWFCRPADRRHAHRSPVSEDEANAGRSRADSPVRYGKTRRKARTDRDCSLAMGFAHEFVFHGVVAQRFARDGLAHEDFMPGQNLSTRRNGGFSHQSNALASHPNPAGHQLPRQAGS